MLHLTYRAVFAPILSSMEKLNVSPVLSSNKTSSGLVVFDGFCVLCSATVKFLIKIDKNKLLKFTTLRSDPSRDNRNETGIETGQPASVIYIENGQVYTESEALVHLLKRLGGIWEMLSAILRIIPRKWRNYLYRLIAKNRYHIFGKKNQCFIPSGEYTDRFVPEMDIEEINAIKSNG